jgi:DNA-binding NarL/FixJ family response regulator
VEVYESMLEERSWRPAHSKSDATHELRSQAAAGSLDRAAVQAVLEAAGEPTRSQRVAWPAELTDREVQVLRHMAEGRRNREIAGALSVSEATVHTHTVNIFAKTGVHTRAGIALFAIENGLLEIARDQPNG